MGFVNKFDRAVPSKQAKVGKREIVQTSIAYQGTLYCVSAKPAFV